MSLSQEWNCYSDAFVANAHQLLAWGYEGARAKITPNHDEPTITGLVVVAIKHKLNSRDIPLHWCFWDVHENPPVSETGLTGKNRPLPDMIIKFADHRPRLEFTCEAKRLKVNDCPIGEYVGVDGLQCFLRGDYASQCPMGAMIAYVQSDTPPAWADKLAAKFAADSTGSLRIKRKLHYIPILSCLPHEWTSEHERESQLPIRIYHIFLDCCSNQAN